MAVTYIQESAASASAPSLRCETVDSFLQPVYKQPQIDNDLRAYSLTSHTNGFSASELWDMSYIELRSVAGLSESDVINFVQTAAQSLCDCYSSCELLESKCIQYFLNFSGSEERIQHNQFPSVSSLTTCLNQTKNHDDTQRGVPSLSIQYSVPDPVNLYNSRKWVLSVISFDRFVGELHYNQRRGFQEMLFLMRRYSCDRGLVEPVFVFNPRNSSIYETLLRHDPDKLKRLSPSNASEQFVWNDSVFRTSLGIFSSPVGALLDMPTLSRALRAEILPYKSFRELSNQTLDELIITDSSLVGHQEELDCSRRVLHVQAELLGVDWNVSRFKCLSEACIEPAFGQAVAESGARSLAVAYRRNRLCLPDAGNPLHQWNDLSFEYLATRAFLRFSREVVTLALDFVRSEFDGQPFLGVHWRRGDRLVYVDSGLSVDPATVVERVLEECAALGLADVYLMTNCGLQSDVNLIVEALQSAGIAVRRLGLFPSWQEEDRRLAVETSIMSFAAHVLISSSAVSSAVLEERVLLGWDPASWGSLAARDGHTVAYEAIAQTVQQELVRNVALGDAVRSQAGLGRRVLGCLHEAPTAECAGLVVDSSRLIAGAVGPQAGGGC